MSKKRSIINWGYLAFLAAMAAIGVLIYFGVGDVW